MKLCMVSSLWWNTAIFLLESRLPPASALLRMLHAPSYIPSSTYAGICNYNKISSLSPDINIGGQTITAVPVRDHYGSAQLTKI